MEIPDQILIPGIYGSLLMLILSGISPQIENILFDRMTYIVGIHDYIWDHLIGGWVLYTFLYLQILLPG
jgi:hypothetical protein